MGFLPIAAKRTRKGWRGGLPDVLIVTMAQKFDSMVSEITLLSTSARRQHTYYYYCSEIVEVNFNVETSVQATTRSSSVPKFRASCAKCNF